ncbi:hypothetical protein CNBL0730 [Cryptococcus deneoformans B-3501A]|uniref:hypothetical protein n=1 Tax=Cryptococcus deneoformans (strain B-3501A) TaxID=283643 RepID=UPI0000430340|nr:hypothetical protein CNBL0730 [Cryptococcus neoformans var. neoformans B-3501A]EAL17811.1 hypothetical protein CNBL0730 [Cryptococcus neoformans var. neoformans B-3501A]
MPTESTTSEPPLPTSHTPAGVVKCSICGIGNLSQPMSIPVSDYFGGSAVEFGERVCGRCALARGHGESDIQSQSQYENQSRDRERGWEKESEVRERGRGGVKQESGRTLDDVHEENETAERKGIVRDLKAPTFSQSLPSQLPQPWTTTKPVPSPPSNARGLAASPKPDAATRSKEKMDQPPNPLLDITRTRVRSIGRGPLYPGSVFKGTQTSGRSAYDVEVKFLDVDFADSTLSGYLSISHLTDSHPHLTTFFTGEIIGPKYGFITGPRYAATEHDDLRHWGRFEQFRRPSTRADLVGEELFLRDPLPDRSRGETKGKERDFVFLRIKEQFLVPDHKVKDISGASFAGFYYIMVDMAPTVTVPVSQPATPLSPTFKSPFVPGSPAISRRMSGTAMPALGLGMGMGLGATIGAGVGPGMGMGGEQVSGIDRTRPARPSGTRKESGGRMREKEVRGEPTIRGYYFHSLNQEPFQELFLSHVPQKSKYAFEFR